MITFLRARHAELITAFVRVSFGLLWLQGASWKNPPLFGLDKKDNLYFWVSQSIAHPVVGLYTALTQSVILPHFLFFAWAIFFSEIAIGLSLVLGAGVRWFALYAFFMTINISLTVLNTPGEWFGSYVLLALVSLMLFAYPLANSVFSLEYWLRIWFTKKA